MADHSSKCSSGKEEINTHTCICRAIVYTKGVKKIVWTIYSTSTNVFVCIVWFLYGIVTLNTRPIIQINRSKDKDINIEIKTDKCLRMHIILHLPDSMLLMSVSTNPGYSFSFIGTVASQSGNGAASENIVRNIDPETQTLRPHTNAALNQSVPNEDQNELSKNIKRSAIPEIIENERNGPHCREGVHEIRQDEILSSDVEDTPNLNSTAQCVQENLKDILGSSVKLDNSKKKFDRYHSVGLNNEIRSFRSISTQTHNTTSNSIAILGYSKGRRIQQSSLCLVQITKMRGCKTRKVTRRNTRQVEIIQAYIVSQQDVKRCLVLGYFSMKELQRPSVLWPSMHPLLLHKQRMIDENGKSP